MDTSANKLQNKKPADDEPVSFMAWGAVAGSGLGLIIGLFMPHWLPVTILVGTLGLSIGAVVDRSRR